MKGGALGRLGRGVPIVLAGTYAEAVTIGLRPGLPLFLAGIAWLLLLVGVALPGRFAVLVALYGFVGFTLCALVVGPSPSSEVPRAFQFLGWLAFVLAWGALSEPPVSAGKGSEKLGPVAAELVSEGHEPIRRGARGVALLVISAGFAAVFALVWGPAFPTLEQRILSQIVFVGLGVLLLSLAGECVGAALELHWGEDGRGRARLGFATVLWLIGTLGLLATAERAAHQAFEVALLAALVSAAASGLGLRSVRSAREN